MNKDKKPKGVSRVDFKKIDKNSQPHVQFKIGNRTPRLNRDETWSDLNGKSTPKLTNKQIKWLKKYDWKIPK